MKEWMKTDKLNDIVKAIGSLAKMDVLVGIPASDGPREDAEEPTNATLGYIHEHGSPAQNIPSRAFLVPGVADAKNKYRPRMIKAAQVALDGNKSGAVKELMAAGLIAETSAKMKINSGPFEPLKPSTILNRHKSRKVKKMRKSEKQFASLISKGMDAVEAQEEAGIKPLINTTRLRNSITHILREKK